MTARLCEAPAHPYLHPSTPHPAYLNFGYYCVVTGKWAAWYFACKPWLDMLRPQLQEGKHPHLSIHRWRGGKAA